MSPIEHPSQQRTFSNVRFREVTRIGRVTVMGATLSPKQVSGGGRNPPGHAGRCRPKGDLVYPGASALLLPPVCADAPRLSANGFGPKTPGKALPARAKGAHGALVAKTGPPLRCDTFRREEAEGFTGGYPGPSPARWHPSTREPVP